MSPSDTVEAQSPGGSCQELDFLLGVQAREFPAAGLPGLGTQGSRLHCAFWQRPRPLREAGRGRGTVQDWHGWPNKGQTNYRKHWPAWKPGAQPWLLCVITGARKGGQGPVHRQPPSDLCTLPLSVYIHMEYLPSVPSPHPKTPHLPSPTPFIFPKFCNSPALLFQTPGEASLGQDPSWLWEIYFQE